MNAPRQWRSRIRLARNPVERKDHESARPIVLLEKPAPDPLRRIGVIDNEALEIGAEVGLEPFGELLGNLDSASQNTSDPQLLGAGHRRLSRQAHALVPRDERIQRLDPRLGGTQTLHQRGLGGPHFIAFCLNLGQLRPLGCEIAGHLTTLVLGCGSCGPGLIPFLSRPLQRRCNRDQSLLSLTYQAFELCGFCSSRILPSLHLYPLFAVDLLLGFSHRRSSLHGAAALRDFGQRNLFPGQGLADRA